MHAVVLRTSRIQILGLIWMSCAAHLVSVQAECPSSYNCLACNDSVPGQEKCTSCYQYYALTTTSPQQCQPCGYRCRVCQVGQPCQTCDTSYGPNFTYPTSSDCGACYPGPDLCAGGCATNGAGKCDSCTSGYRLESNNSACSSCPANCRNCQTSGTTCDTCDTGICSTTVQPPTQATGPSGPPATVQPPTGPTQATDPSRRPVHTILPTTQAAPVQPPAQGGCPSFYNCLTCDRSIPGEEQCGSCYQYYGLTTTSPQQCQPCGYRCRECQIGQMCQTCDTGYGPNFTSPNGDCGACYPGPNLCAGGCMRNGAGKCDSCAIGYSLESSNSACSPCGPRCRSCQSSSATCDVCSPGYFPYANHTCGPCAANCNTYQCQKNGAGKCDKCDSGYGLTATKTCAPCSPNCNLTIGCNTAGTCLQCNNGYGLSPNQSCGPCSPNCAAGCNATGAYKCDKCDPGTGLSTNGACLPCALNCNDTIGCNSAGTCLLCNNGYGLISSSQSCGPCSADCASCVTVDNCTQCLAGFVLIETGTCVGLSIIPQSTKSPGSGGSIATDGGNGKSLEIGLGIGVSCGVIILTSLVVIVVLLHQKRGIRKELEEARQELEEARQELEEAKQELEEARQELEEKRKKLEEARKELEEKRKKLEETRQQLEEARQELEETKKKLEETSKKLEQANYQRLYRRTPDYEQIERFIADIDEPGGRVTPQGSSNYEDIIRP